MDRTFIPEVIGTLSPEEQKEFGLFLQSPFFNRGKFRDAIPVLFRILQENAANTDIKKPDKRTIYARLYPELPWVEGKLDKVLVDLKKLLQLFLQIQGYLKAENDFQRQLDLIKTLRVRGLTARSEDFLSKLHHEHGQNKQHNSTFAMQAFLLEEEQYFQATYSNQIKGDLNIPDALFNLDVFFHAKRLDLLNHFLMQQKLTGAESPQPVIQALNQGPAPAQYAAVSTSLLIANKIFELLHLKQISPDHYSEILSLLRQHEQSIGPETLKEFYTYLRNFCSFLVLNDPDSAFTETLHLLHRDNLTRGYLFGDEEQRLPRGTFLNIVIIALKVRAIEWLEQFLETYKFRIIGDNESLDLYRVGVANFLFAKGKFSETLHYIPAFSPYVDYHLMARRLELKIYYETESDLLTYKLNAFKMYISRASKKFLSDTMRRWYLNFANFLNQIIFSQPGDKKRIARLRQRIKQEKWTPDRDWLLEKLDRMSS